jgi:hypothetical protein
LRKISADLALRVSYPFWERRRESRPWDRYTETVVYSPTPQFVNDVPYQLAIVELENGRRLTARVAGEKVSIGDRVDFIEFRDEIPFFRKKS